MEIGALMTQECILALKSYFVFVKKHIWDTIPYGELSSCFWTNQETFHYMNFEQNMM